MSLSDHFFSDATRQAFRDNYNGGRAAGDWAGVYSNPGGSRDYSVSSGQTAGDGNDRADGSATFSKRVGGGQVVGVGHVQSASAVTTGPGVARAGTGRLPMGPASGIQRSHGYGDFTFSTAPEIDGIKNVELERIGIGGRDEAPGAVSWLGWTNTGTGYLPVPSSDVKEKIEDNFFLEGLWFVQNYVLPHMGLKEYPKPNFLDDEHSHFDEWSGEWRAGSNPRKDANGNTIVTGGSF